MAFNTTVSAVLAAVLLSGSAVAGEKNYKVDYVGGSLNLKAHAGLKLYIMQDRVELRKGRDTLVSIPASALTVRIGGNGVKMPGVADLGLSVATLGFSSVLKISHMKLAAIGFDWTENGKAHNIVFATDGEWRQMLANLETLTGRKTTGL